MKELFKQKMQEKKPPLTFKNTKKNICLERNREIFFRRWPLLLGVTVWVCARVWGSVCKGMSVHKCAIHCTMCKIVYSNPRIPHLSTGPRVDGFPANKYSTFLAPNSLTQKRRGDENPNFISLIFIMNNKSGKSNFHAVKKQ